MRIYDLEFTDGKQCRHIVPQPQATEEEELRITQAIFCGRLKSMIRIIAPPPERLPWKRDGDGWRLGDFVLTKRFDEEDQKTRFLLKWPGNELGSYDKEAISTAVRQNWAHAT
ncbi:hypothetical protein D3C76_997430 [compost metagenome]